MRRSKTISLFTAFLMLIALLTACASIRSIPKMEKFEQISKQYKYTLISSDLEAAARMAAPEDHIEPDKLKKIRVVNYEVKKVSVSEDKSAVYQEVEIEYYRTDTMIQKRLRDEQQWKYDSEAKQWVLTSGLPKFQI